MNYLFCFLYAICMSMPMLANAFDADVVFLGEFHDNPHHHDRQATLASEIKPKALVFEMLTEEQAAQYDSNISEVALKNVLNGSTTSWPDFKMYYPIFASAPNALVYGAGIPRSIAKKVISTDLASVFEGYPDSFGLNEPLDPDEQNAREILQMNSHCNALPAELLPKMVLIQRLRDAKLAKTALQAFHLTGGPVVVITGNAHARLDWGAPRYLIETAPNLKIFSLAQSENGTKLKGKFDRVESTVGIKRPDPCLVFN